VFVAKPSYNNPESLVPIAGSAKRYFFHAIDAPPRGSIRRLIQSVAYRFHLLAALQYAFIVIGRKP
jgi:hypothetical protein